MKTSKIIFISLLSTIAILILATSIDIRIHGRRNDEKQIGMVNKQILPVFKSLSVYNSRSITLIKNDSSYIEVSYLKDSIPARVNYTIIGDTLRVSDFEKSNHPFCFVTIYVTDSLRSVQLKKSNISIELAGLEKLFFALDESELWLNQNTVVKSSSTSLDIVARNHSRINSSDFRIDSIGLNLQKSEANLELRARNISGTLSDSSKIVVRQPAEISLKKDATSRINVNDY